MRLLRVKDVGQNYKYKWPEDVETFTNFVDYVAEGADGEHQVRVGFTEREAYGKLRVRIVVWIDGYPHAEFLGADDCEKSGDVLSVIKLSGIIVVVASSVQM